MTSIQTQGDLNLKMMLQLLVLLQLGNAVTGKMECCLDFSSWASPALALVLASGFFIRRNPIYREFWQSNLKKRYFSFNFRFLSVERSK